MNDIEVLLNIATFQLYLMVVIILIFWILLMGVLAYIGYKFLKQNKPANISQKIDKVRKRINKARNELDKNIDEISKGKVIKYKSPQERKEAKEKLEKRRMGLG